MSTNDSIRAEVMARVAAGALTLKQAAQLLGVSYRHAKRLSQRYQRDGSAGLEHGHTGHRSNRAKPDEIRELALAFVRQRCVDGLGPTHAASELANETGLIVSQETLRRWMLEAGLWNGSRTRHSVRTLEKRTRFGELVVARGRICSWPEERRVVNWIVELVDEATGTVALRVTREAVWALAGALRSWVERYGIPRALQIDWSQVGLRQVPTAPRLTGTSSVSQFGRMCAALELTVVAVRAPEESAAALDEHWRQLTSQFRDRGIRDDKAANAYLDGEYVPEYNRRFGCPVDGEDCHRPPATGVDLEAIFRLEEERPINDDWTVQYRGRLYQVHPESRYAPAGNKVLVREWPNRRLEICYRGRAVKWEPVPAGRNERGHFYRVKTGTFLTSDDARS
jgi:transposase